MDKVKFIIVVVILFSLILINDYINKLNTVELFDNNYESNLTDENAKSLISSKLYEKNMDAKYQLNRLNVNNDEDILKPISPINNSKKYYSKSDKIKLLDNETTTRVPDENSTQEILNIPTPNTEPEYRYPEFENGEWYENMQNDNSTKVIQTNSKKNMVDRTCRFIGSYEKEPNCPVKYNNYLGASIGSKGSSLICNDEEIENSKASAVASIANGKIENIFITHNGANYKKEPHIRIIGDGTNATAHASIKKGQVTKIIITNPGKDYKSTPIVDITPPDGEVFCHLCCKDF